MIEPVLVSVLAPLVGGRLFPDFAPADTPRPFATYQQVGGQAGAYVEGAPIDKKNARMQINVWADTRQEAMTLIRAIEDTIVCDPLCGDPLGAPVALYDAAIGMRGAMQDFSLWG
mgnify:CR=1 FL=1